MDPLDARILDDPGFVALIAIGLMLIGPCLGSFASAIAYRAPRGISWISDQGKGARSACPHCGYQLGFLDLIPILSWIFLRGRCRSCHAPVSALYPVLEITAFILALAALKTVGVSFTLLALLLALPFLLALVVISWQGFALPRQVLIILGCLAVPHTLSHIGDGQNPIKIILDPILGTALYSGVGLIFMKLRQMLVKQRPVVSDVGILAVAGLWLGTQVFPVFLIVAGVMGVIAVVVRVFLKMPRIHIMTHAYTLALIVLLFLITQIVILLTQNMAQLIP